MNYFHRDNYKQNNEVSIVVCYNNLEKFDLLKKTLQSQSIISTIFGVDNRCKKFTSIASAYNYALGQVNTKYVIFSHQDIILDNSDMLKNYLNYIKKINNKDILGVAGVKNNNPLVYSCSFQSIEKKKITGDLKFNGIMEVFSVDECFFGGYTNNFKKLLFDSKTCNSWHLYAVEICLRSILQGNKVFICDVPLIHTSMGRIDSDFNKCFWKLCKKYDGKFSYVRTTCAHSRTGFAYRIFWFIKSQLIYYSVTKRIKV